MAFLSAADARAGRVYERIGFYPFADDASFSDPATPEIEIATVLF